MSDFERLDVNDLKLLRALVVVPEGGLAHLGLHGLDLPLLLIAVKETSTGVRRAS